MADGAPHRVVGGVVNSLLRAAQGIGSGINSGVRGIGEGVQSGLDMPFRAVGGPEQPLRIADRFLDGWLGAVDNFANRGWIDSTMKFGEGISRGLDQPHEQFGIPPSFGGMGGYGPGSRFQVPFPRPRMM